MTISKQIPIRVPVLLIAGAGYYAFRLYLHGWSIDADAWGFLYAGRVLFEQGNFIGDPNKLFVHLAGLIPVLFDAPLLFPLITGLFAGAACWVLYELILTLTGHRGYALAGWGILLLSPVLYWLVLSCNSVVYATCFLLGSLYFLTRGETTKGAAFLVLASLCRPESFVLIAFIAGYALWQWKKKEMPAATLRGVLVFLALPPLFWLAANFLKTGDALYAFQVAQSYTQNTGQSYSGSDFPRHFLQLLSTYYYPVLGLAISAAGFVLFIRKFRSLMFLYVYLVLSILGYWVLAPFNIPLLERYLLPITVYLIVFGVLLCRDLESRWSRPGSSEKQGFAPAALLPALLVPVYLHLPAHTAVNQIINYHKVFDADIPKVADHFRAEIAKRDRSRMKIMVSSRREGQLNYLLYDQLPRLSISSIRQIYFNESDLAREQAEWVVYAPDDFYPLKSAFYMFDLLSAEGLKKQGIQVGESQRISEHTQLLHLTR